MPTIDDALETDYPGILALNANAVPAVNLIDREELAELDKQSHATLVARSADGIAGFMIALDETACYDSPNFQFFKARYARFVYVDRIVVCPSMRGKGIGAELYAALFERSAAVPRITCEVNVEPPNPRSMSFHQRLGFETVAEQATEGGRKRVALMVRTRDG